MSAIIVNLPEAWAVGVCVGFTLRPLVDRWTHDSPLPASLEGTPERTATASETQPSGGRMKDEERAAELFASLEDSPAATYGQPGGFHLPFERHGMTFQDPTQSDVLVCGSIIAAGAVRHDGEVHPALFIRYAKPDGSETARTILVMDDEDFPPTAANFVAACEAAVDAAKELRND